MKKLLFGVLTAFGVALGANAAETGAETTFEKGDTTVSVQEDKSLLLTDENYWSVDGVEETGVATTSKVTAYTEAGVEKGTANGGFGDVTGMNTSYGTQYLQIDADSVLLRKNTATLSTETTSYYIDTMVKFTATDLIDEQMEKEIAPGEKIVVWMYQPSEPLDGSTVIPAPVLKVAAGCVDSVDGNNNSQASVSPLTYTASGTYTENKWYRLSVKAINKAFEGAEAVCFVVCIDGKPLTYDKQFYKDGVASIFATPSSMYRSLKGSILPSRVQGNSAKTLTGLGFKGNGAVDNILFSSAAPCDKLIDGSAVMLFKVGDNEFASWEEAVNAASTATGDTTIKLLTNEFTDSEGTTTHLKLDLSGVALNTDKTVVLDLNGKTLSSISQTSIEILGNAESTGKATVQIVDKVGGATVQGDVIVDTWDAIIGDVSENDKGVIYAGTLNAYRSTITLCKGKFVNNPTVPTWEIAAGATVASGYELVNPAFEGDYYTIAKSTAPTTTSVTITLGEGVASATYTIGDAQGVEIKETTPVEVAIGAVIKVTATAATGYTAKTVEDVTVTAETKTINVTAARNNYDLTITLGDGVASATYKLGDAEAVAVVSGTPVSVPYKTAVTISATAAEGYTLNKITDASFNMPAEAKSVSITAVPKTGALTVTWTDKKNITKVVYIVDKVETELVSGTAVDIEVGKTVTIVATVSGWNKVTGIPEAFAMTAEGKSVTIEVAAISADTDIGETTKPEDVGITGGDFASAAPTELKKVVNWAKDKNVSVADVNAMNFTTPGIKEEAYLLNCANTEDAVTAAKAEFKITSFTLVDGKLTPTLPSGYNGTVREKGTDSISGNTINWTYVTPENRGQFKFIKAVLEAVLTK